LAAAAATSGRSKLTSGRAKLTSGRAKLTSGSTKLVPPSAGRANDFYDKKQPPQFHSVAAIIIKILIIIIKFKSAVQLSPCATK
jgi:hypothetical protein